jgi:hypothetical protein
VGAPSAAPGRAHQDLAGSPCRLAGVIDQLGPFRDAVTRTTDGTPYTVTARDDGFDVGLDIVDARWLGIYSTQGLKRAFLHRVAVDGDHYTVTDRTYSVSWSAGIPRLKMQAEAFVGRKYQFSSQKTWALNGKGEPAKVVDYTFSSAEGRGLIKAAAREVGLKERMPLSVKAPLIFGIVVGVLSIGGVLAAWLLDAF